MYKLWARVPNALNKRIVPNVLNKRSVQGPISKISSLSRSFVHIQIFCCMVANGGNQYHGCSKEFHKETFATKGLARARNVKGKFTSQLEILKVIGSFF